MAGIIPEEIVSAVQEGDQSIVSIYLDQHPDHVRSVTADSRETLLHLAASQGHLVSLLLSRGADVNAHAYYDDTPLTHALARGHQQIAKVLREHGGTDY